jgi:hypothetical protein
VSEEAPATTRRVLASDESDGQKSRADATAGDSGCIARNLVVAFGGGGVRAPELGIIGS